MSWLKLPKIIGLSKGFIYNLVYGWLLDKGLEYIGKTSLAEIKAHCIQMLRNELADGYQETIGIILFEGLWDIVIPDVKAALEKLGLERLAFMDQGHTKVRSELTYNLLSNPLIV